MPLPRAGPLRGLSLCLYCGGRFVAPRALNRRPSHAQNNSVFVPRSIVLPNEGKTRPHDSAAGGIGLRLSGTERGKGLICIPSAREALSTEYDLRVQDTLSLSSSLVLLSRSSEMVSGLAPLVLQVLSQLAKNAYMLVDYLMEAKLSAAELQDVGKDVAARADDDETTADWSSKSTGSPQLTMFQKAGILAKIVFYGPRLLHWYRRMKNSENSVVTDRTCAQTLLPLLRKAVRLRPCVGCASSGFCLLAHLSPSRCYGGPPGTGSCVPAIQPDHKQMRLKRILRDDLTRRQRSVLATTPAGAVQFCSTCGSLVFFVCGGRCRAQMDEVASNSLNTRGKLR